MKGTTFQKEPVLTHFFDSLHESRMYVSVVLCFIDIAQSGMEVAKQLRVPAHYSV